MTISHNKAVRSLQIVNHILMTAGIVYLFVFNAWLYLAIAILTYWTIGILGINVGYHRLISHKSFRTLPWIERALAIIGILTTVGSPLAWTAVHRQHHRAAETANDVHSPYHLGSWRAWFGVWNYSGIELKLVRELRKDAFHKWCHKYYFAIIAVYVLMLLLIDPWLVVFAYSIPACLCLHSSSAIIVIAHIHGYKTYNLKHDQSRNSWIANLITMGEGWHNNHHAKPWAWSNWERWWEWDIPSLVIRAIKTNDSRR